MSTHTILMNKKEIVALEHKLKDMEIKKTPPYALFQRKCSDCTITAYESGKVVFQGEGADFYAGSQKEQELVSSAYPESGSDEVGTGDYFGPVVVCATYVQEENLPLLKTLKIQDSKQLKDEDIIKIAPIIMKDLIYSLLILDNTKYNEIHQTANMNAIKAKLHNQAFLHLEKKVGNKLKRIIIDQFTPEKNYYHYLKEEKEVMRNIHFETKAENKYLSVACGSIIARYAFLQAMQLMNEKYDFDFPKGAGAHVDEAGMEFVKQYGWNMMMQVCKYHFKNSEKIKIAL